MRVLLVEDDENKRNRLHSFLVEFFGDAEISVARSVHSAEIAIRDLQPAVVVLDMTLPNYDTSPEEAGGQMYQLGGMEVLAQMDRFDIIVPVVVVTQFQTFGKGPKALNLETLTEQLHSEFPASFKGIVYYHAGIRGWELELRKLLDGLSLRGRTND